MLHCYWNPKSDDQKTASQIRALKEAGCKKVFEESASGGRWDRPQLHRLLDQLRAGDTLVVWKLDRLSRSLKDLLTMALFQQRYVISHRVPSCRFGSSAAKKMALHLPRLVFDENHFVAPKISRKLLSYQRLSLKESATKNGRFLDNLLYLQLASNLSRQSRGQSSTNCEQF